MIGNKMSSKWVVFGSCLLFFASGCLLYALVMTRHLVDDEFETTDAQTFHDDTSNSNLQNDLNQTENYDKESESDQPKEKGRQIDQQQNETEPKVLLLEQSMSNGNEVSNPDPRVHYERTPDGRMKATMDITLHYQRQRVVSQRKGNE